MNLNDMTVQQLHSAVLNAIDKNQIEIWFQPQVDCAAKSIIGAEALCRWKTDEGIIMPGRFIPRLEQAGLTYELDKCIWNEVCRAIHERMTTCQCIIPVSVNISRVDLMHENFLDEFCTIVNNWHVPHKLLHLEITESAYVADTNIVCSKVRKLKSLGFVIMMDDFGTGMSSLYMLNELPVDIIKIDARFMHGLSDAKMKSIVSCIVDLARALGMDIVTEGVENAKQARFMLENDCPVIQGFLFYKPMCQKTLDFLLRTCAYRPFA